MDRELKVEQLKKSLDSLDEIIVAQCARSSVEWSILPFRWKIKASKMVSLSAINDLESMQQRARSSVG